MSFSMTEWDGKVWGDDSMRLTGVDRDKVLEATLKENTLIVISP